MVRICRADHGGHALGRCFLRPCWCRRSSCLRRPPSPALPQSLWPLSATTAEASLNFSATFYDPDGLPVLPTVLQWLYSSNIFDMVKIFFVYFGNFYVFSLDIIL